MNVVLVIVNNPIVEQAAAEDAVPIDDAQAGHADDGVSGDVEHLGRVVAADRQQVRAGALDRHRADHARGLGEVERARDQGDRPRGGAEDGRGEGDGRVAGGDVGQIDRLAECERPGCPDIGGGVDDQGPRLNGADVGRRRRVAGEPALVGGGRAGRMGRDLADDRAAGEWGHGLCRPAVVAQGGEQGTTADEVVRAGVAAGDVPTGSLPGDDRVGQRGRAVVVQATAVASDGIGRDGIVGQAQCVGATVGDAAAIDCRVPRKRAADDRQAVAVAVTRVVVDDRAAGAGACRILGKRGVAHDDGAPLVADGTAIRRGVPRERIVRHGHGAPGPVIKGAALGQGGVARERVAGQRQGTVLGIGPPGATVDGAAIRRGVPHECRVGDRQHPIVEQAAAEDAVPIDDAQAGHADDGVGGDVEHLGRVVAADRQQVRAGALDRHRTGHARGLGEVERARDQGDRLRLGAEDGRGEGDGRVAGGDVGQGDGLAERERPGRRDVGGGVDDQGPRLDGADVGRRRRVAGNPRWSVAGVPPYGPGPADAGLPGSGGMVGRPAVVAQRGRAAGYRR